VRVINIGAEYALKVSNGAYGSEEVRMTVMGQLGDSDEYSGGLDELVEELRDKVITQLRRSHFPKVREALADYTPGGEVDDTPF
jgi:hypothetical protein